MNLNEMYMSIKCDLERKYAASCAKMSISVEELVDTAFIYVATGIHGGVVKEPETSIDLYRLISKKAKYLVLDADRAQKVDHGKKSVKAKESLDALVAEDDSRCQIEKASFERWKQDRADEEDLYRQKVARHVLHKALKESGMSERNRKIFYATVMHEVSPVAVAEKFGVSRGNVDAIVHRGMKVLGRNGKEIFKKFYDAA